MNEIPLFYWSSIKFENKPKENYGDLLSKYLVEKISGKKVKWVHPRKQAWYKLNKTNYLGIGSILAHASKKSIVWGSGIIDQNHSVHSGDFRAVRGPKTRERLLNLGFDCPEIYGDPALLLPKYFNPETEKKYKLGIVPHYVDFEDVTKQFSKEKEIIVIDMLTDDIELTTSEILSCEKVVSSSLHGLIVAHAYGIPAAWVKFSDRIFGDGIKYQDYFFSVGLCDIECSKVQDKDRIQFNSERYDYSCPHEEKLNEIRFKLLENCPF